jgi:hypothetical protein
VLGSNVRSLRAAFTNARSSAVRLGSVAVGANSGVELEPVSGNVATADWTGAGAPVDEPVPCVRAVLTTPPRIRLITNAAQNAVQ